MSEKISLWVIIFIAFFVFSCGDDDDSSEAVYRGVGAGCETNEDCSEEEQQCLEFKGGYCGLKDCTKDEDCPEGSACVTFDDAVGTNYCFLICTEKWECNEHRSVDDESNCSSNKTFVDGKKDRKSCVPPSGA